MDFLQLGQETLVIQSFHHPGITACSIVHKRNTQSNTRTDSTMSGMTVRFTRHAIRCLLSTHAGDWRTLGRRAIQPKSCSSRLKIQTSTSDTYY